MHIQNCKRSGDVRFRSQHNCQRGKNCSKSTFDNLVEVPSFHENVENYFVDATAQHSAPSQDWAAEHFLRG